MISREDIKKLANLARIKLSEEEEGRFAKEIESILGYVAQIQKVSGKEDVKTAGAVRNVLREDSEPHEAGIFSEDLIAEAPQKDGEYVKVKKIL